MIYLRNRYYDPATGRFITEDPIRDGVNWYSYCEGNPVMFVDPSGYITIREQEMYNQGLLRQDVYEILVGLGNRWIEMKTQESKDEVHRLAEDFRNNNYQYIDCTTIADNQLQINGYEIKNQNIVFDGLEWYNKVKPGGEWDYKVNSAWWMPKENYFVYYGMLISEADYGNINYGYTGTILGINPDTIYKGGGYVNDKPTKYEKDHYYGILKLPVKILISTVRKY